VEVDRYRSGEAEGVDEMTSFIARLFRSLICTCICAATFAYAAPDAKTVRFSFLIAETEFDPVRSFDLYSNQINDAIFEPLLTYDYLARPAKLKPNMAVAMPEVTEDGKVYTFKIRPGVFFADDPAFGGKKREVTAQDFAYTLRRLYDPKNRSPWVWYVEGKVIGGDETAEAAKKTGRYDYDATIKGIETPDKYTLRISIKEPDYNFLYIFATVQTCAMAREVVERYANEVGAHPVGSGPFRLTEWRRSSKMVLEANPNYRDVYFDEEPADDPMSQAIAARMKGKKLPQVQRVEVSVIEESQPRWLAFINGETDYANVPAEFISYAFPGGKVAPFLAKANIQGQRFVETELVYTYFNLDDPVVGGVTPEKVALRRAMAMGYDVQQEIAVIRNGGAVRASSAIPPGVEGYDPNFRLSDLNYNPARAKSLLDLYGYIDRNGDGYRETPDGKPLVVEMGNEPDTTLAQFAALWKKNMDAIGINITFKRAKWPDLNKQAKAGKLAMWQLAWGADYPDAENFFQSLYGPNATEGGGNFARFRNARFDALYEAARRLPPSPERNKLYAEMNRLIAVYVPWIPLTHRYRNEVWQPWVVGYMKHPILSQPWRYIDIDDSKRPVR
jgi:oligopeptide transport system substrate-binding protein